MAEEPKPEGEGVEGEDTRRSSRTQLKREASEVNQLGYFLITLRPADLDRLELPGALRQAIAVCQGLKIRAQSRQKRLIGQLLREEDHEAIRMRAEALRVRQSVPRKQDSVVEQWRDRILEEGDAGLQAFVEECPGADRQQLRALARSARKDGASPKSVGARRELLRAIRKVHAE